MPQMRQFALKGPIKETEAISCEACCCGFGIYLVFEETLVILKRRAWNPECQLFSSESVLGYIGALKRGSFALWKIVDLPLRGNPRV